MLRPYAIDTKVTLDAVQKVTGLPAEQPNQISFMVDKYAQTIYPAT